MTTAPAPQVFGVLLAGGTSTRFGSGPKLAATVGGESLLQRACRAVVDSRLHSAVAVLGADADQLQRYCDAAGLPWVHNPHAAQGQSTSLRRGLTEAPHSATGCLFVAADQPLLTADDVNRVLDAAVRHDCVVRSVATAPGDGERVQGTPVYFPRRLFDRLMQVTGDEGGKQVIRTLPRTSVLDVELRAAALLDVDSEHDLLRLGSSDARGGKDG